MGVHDEYMDNLEAENARLKQWVADLQSKMYVNCVYCGHRYGPESTTPVSMADALKAHIEQCPEHPMSKLKAEHERVLAGVRKAIQECATCAGQGFEYVDDGSGEDVTGEPCSNCCELRELIDDRTNYLHLAAGL